MLMALAPEKVPKFTKREHGLIFCDLNKVKDDWKPHMFFNNKNCWWLDSNTGLAVSEATALPTVPQLLPKPHFCDRRWRKFLLFKKINHEDGTED